MGWNFYYQALCSARNWVSGKYGIDLGNTSELVKSQKDVILIEPRLRMSLHYNHAPQISEIQIQSYELKKQKQKHKTTDFLNHWEGRKNIEGIQFDGRKKNTV